MVVLIGAILICGTLLPELLRCLACALELSPPLLTLIRAVWWPNWKLLLALLEPVDDMFCGEMNRFASSLEWF